MKRLSRNFLAIIGSDVARRFLGFLAIAYLARKIGVPQFGAVSIGFAVLSYATMFSALGLTYYGVRETARADSRNLVNVIVSIRFIAGFFTYAIIISAALLFISRETALIIIIFCFSLFPFSFLIEWYFQGKERMGFIGAGRIISAIIYFGLIILCVHSPLDILWVAFAAVLGDIANAIFLWIVYRQVFGGERFRFVLTDWRHLLKSSLPLGYGSLIAGFTVNLPQVTLGIIMTNNEVGLFSAASKLVLFMLMFDRVLATLLIPASSRLHESSPELLTSALTLSMKWILLLTLPVCVGGSILSGDIMQLVFGIQYVQSSFIFRILIWFFLFTMLHTVYTSGLIAAGREKIYGSVMIASGFIYLVFVTGGIFIYGVIGAAVAMVLSEAVTLMIMRFRYHEMNKIPLPGNILWIIFSASVMGILVYLLPPVPVLFAILAGALIYGIMIILTKSVTIEELLALVKRV